MAKNVLVLGESKSGKSTAIGGNKDFGIEGLDPLETFIIQTTLKDLPFPSSTKSYKKVDRENPKGNLYVTRDSDKIVEIITKISESKKSIKNIVIDDLQYLMGFHYMDEAHKKGYQIFNDIANTMWKITEPILSKGDALRDDLYIFFLTHAEVIDQLGDKIIRAKTVGKQFDQYVTLEGLFNIVLYATKEGLGENMKYGFRTKSKGELERIGAPAGMFDESFIPNDLAFVKKKVKEYYGI